MTWYKETDLTYVRKVVFKLITVKENNVGT